MTPPVAIPLSIVVALQALLTFMTIEARGSTVTRVGEDLYAYVSDNDASANSTFLVGADEILVVDTGFDGREAKRLLAEIRKISPLPVGYVVNTHYHRDHQAGNGIVGPEAQVISTVFTRERTLWFTQSVVPQLEARLRGPDLESLRSTRFRPATLVFSDRMELHMGRHRVEIAVPGKGHTSGDLLVTFPAQGVVAMGDLLLTDSCPAMDSGSVRNWITTLEALLKGPADTFVPGHFEVASKETLRRFHDYLSDLYELVRRQVAAGASLEQVRRSVGHGGTMKDYVDFRQYPRFQATFEDNAEVIFQEIVTEASQR